MPLSLFIGLPFFGVLNKVKAIEGVFSLTGVTIDAGRKSFGESGKFRSFSFIIVIFTLVFISIDFIYNFLVYNEVIDMIL